MRLRELALAAVALAAPAPQEAVPLPPRALAGAARDSFLDRVEERMAKVESVVATFEQDVHLALFSDTVRTSGVLLFRRPDRLRWETQAPFRSALVVAGAEVAKFEWSESGRRKLELGWSAGAVGVAMERIRDWFRGRFDRTGKEYELEAYDGPEPRLVLKPRAGSLGPSLLAIDVVFAAELDAIASVTLREASGSTEMRFTLVRRDAALEESLFDTAAPRDVDLDALRDQQ